MGERVVLSARMRALADMVTAGNRACDVGCDHGWVSIYLVQQGISPHVLAMDVRRGPLRQAQEHIRQQGLGAYIEARLSDGVAALSIGEADTVICAGMGGRLMQRILEEGREKLESLDELVLQPQSELAALRAYLRRAGYRAVAEDMVYEDGKYYPMMKVRPGRPRPGDTGLPPGVGSEISLGASPDSDADRLALQDSFGQLLLAGRHPVLKQYLLAADENHSRILKQLTQNAAEGGRTALRIRELAEEQRLIRLALAVYEK